MIGKTLSEIQSLISKGKLSVSALAEHYLNNIEKTKHLNIYTEIFREDLLEAAGRLDAKIRSGVENPGRLFGCIISVKDLICIKDKKISAGSGILPDFVSKYNAHLIQTLLDEDALFIGSTNCDEFGMGSATVNCVHGAVRNALDPDKIAGGSSGGAAVSVQADTCLVALGTDTGGSVRQPASMCGVSGYKPTYGIVSRSGLIAYASSFDQVGIISRHVEDMDRIMEVISCIDHADATMYRHSLYPQQQFGIEEKKDGNYKIAYFTETLNAGKNNPAIEHAFQNTIDKFELAGHTVSGVQFKWLDYLVPCYYILTTAEASSNLSRYDGVRYGYRTPAATNLRNMYVRSRTEGFGKEVKKRIMLGTFVLSEAYYDAYYSQAQRVRRLISNYMEQLFESFDFLIMPATPHTAWRVDEQPADPLQVYFADVYTVLANLSGTPAISVPAGTDGENMPFGMQVYAGRLMDKKLLKFASEIDILA